MEDSVRLYNEIIDCLNGDLNRYTSLKLCEHTPKILQMCGLDDKPILFTQEHLRLGLSPKYIDPNGHTHGLNINNYINLIKEIENPVNIADSLTRQDSIVVTSSMLDIDNLPIIASIKINGSGIYELNRVGANYMTFVYGRNDYEGFLKHILKENKFLFVDKEKTQALESFAELQLLRAFPKDFRFDSIIHCSENIVNKNDEKSYATAQRDAVKDNKRAAGEDNPTKNKINKAK